MPLYTLWYEAPAVEVAYAAFHCTLGDVLIAGASLLLSLVIVGVGRRPADAYPMVVPMTLVIGLVYTIFSEWLNTEIRGSWAYAESMPVVPIIGAGASPLAQWIVVPLLGLYWAKRSLNRRETP